MQLAIFSNSFGRFTPSASNPSEAALYFAIAAAKLPAAAAHSSPREPLSEREIVYTDCVGYGGICDSPASSFSASFTKGISFFCSAATLSTAPPALAGCFPLAAGSSF